MNQNRAHLTPTVVTDKNGRLTTVHKKPQSLASAVSLPSPSMPVMKTLSESRRSVVGMVEATYSQFRGAISTRRLPEQVQGYPERAVRHIELALQGSDDLAQGVAEQLVLAENPTFILETIHYYGKTNSKDFWTTEAEVRALHQYPVVNINNDLSAVDEYVQQQCLALMKFPQLIDAPRSPSPFLDYLPGDRRDTRVINTPELATLIAMRPEDVEQIAEIVLKYRTSDAATINGLLNGERPTFAAGHL